MKTKTWINALCLVAAVLAGLIVVPSSSAQAPTTDHNRPLRVAIAGLVHGHAIGFLRTYQHRTDLQIVGIAEPDQAIFAKYASRFQLDPALYHSDLEEMLQKTHPDAVLIYTNTLDHRRVVEICARYGVSVMMEKPLAVSVEDALAIKKAAEGGNIHVLVNYETTWYRSNHAAYDLAHDNSIGDIRKVVVHDGHQGPKEIGVGPEFLSWLTDPKLNGGGALFDFGCYGADLMTWLMNGRAPDTVTAVTQHIKPEVYPKVDDEATIVLTYPKAQAIIQASWNWPYDRKDMEVYGATGYVITDHRDGIRLRRENKEAQLPFPYDGPMEEVLRAKSIPAPYDDPISELRAVLFDGATPDGLTSLETNVIVTEILSAARVSAATGKTVRLTPED